MTSRDFCYWLQGHFELSDPEMLDAAMTEKIKRHLAMVFKHEIDPSHGDKTVQEILDQLHTPQHVQHGNQTKPGHHLDQTLIRC